MTIKLAPSVVKPEEDGYLQGVVESVSPFPVSEQSMLRAVRNESLVWRSWRGPVYEARVRVGSDPPRPAASGGRTDRAGNQIASGTPVHGLVTVKTRRPSIDRARPRARRHRYPVGAGAG